MIKKLKELIERSHFWKFIVFCFVGGTSALVHLIFFNLFFFIFNQTLNTKLLLFGASINYIIAFFIGTTISMIYNFNMNRNITFSANDVSAKKQAPKYILVYAVSTSVNFISSLIVLNLLGNENTINANIATICGIIISIPFSYLGSLLWTFKKKNN